MNNQKKNNKTTSIIFFACYFIVTLVFAFLIPEQLDDWAWGGQIGLDRLSNWFDNYSGRYVGNLIVLALTRSLVLRSFVMALTLTGIIYMIYKFTQSQNSGHIIAALLALFIPLHVFRQTVAWVSGFSNYVTSIALILVYLCATNSMYEEKPKQSFIKSILFAILGFASSMIVEHVTLYSIVLGLYILLFNLIKYKKLIIQNLLYFIGTILGTYLMFSNSVYSQITSGNDSYRSVGNSIKDTIKLAIENFDMIVEFGIEKNLVINTVIAVLVLTLFCTYKKQYWNTTTKTVSKLCVFTIWGYVAFSGLVCIGENIATKGMMCLGFLFTIIYALSLLVFFALLPIELIKRVRLEFLLCSIVILFAPLIVVNPISERCFYPTYIVFILLTLEMYSNLNDKAKALVDKSNKIGLTVLAIGGIYLVMIFATITNANNSRIEKIQQDVAKGESTITVQKLPYNNYIHYDTPRSSLWVERYKNYYGIPQETNVDFVEYKY